jgi:two-component system, LytTR family, sensor histidine kinase AlgZ
MSDERLAEPARRHEFFQSLIERSRDAVVVADSAGTIIYQSPGTLEQLGYGVEECIGRNVLEFVHPDDQALVRRTLRVAHESPGMSEGMELRLWTGFGSWRWVEVRATNLLHVPAVGGIVLNTIVIQDRKALELRNAAAKMDPHFLYNVLHSIATMVRDGQTEQAVEAIMRLRSLTAGRVGVVDDHLVPLATEWGWVEDYLALEQLRFGPDMRFALSPLSPQLSRARVPCRIVQPLAENAVKHGIQSRTEGGDLRLSAELGGGRVRISVVEEGGIREMTHSAEGLGVGLETTRQRLQLHFGDQAQLSLEVDASSSRALLVLPFTVES